MLLLVTGFRVRVPDGSRWVPLPSPSLVDQIIPPCISVRVASLAQRYFAGRTDGLRPPNNSEEFLGRKRIVRTWSKTPLVPSTASGGLNCHCSLVLGDCGIAALNPLLLCEFKPLRLSALGRNFARVIDSPD
jgi:hypothetical protein